MMKHFLRAALGAAAAVGVGIGATGALADGYYVGSVKDSAPMPAPVAYEWNGFSIGAGIGVGRIEQDVFGGAGRKDTYEKKRKVCTWFGIIMSCSWVWRDYSPLPSILTSESSTEEWSFFGTAQVGYDRLLRDRFLIGAFADFDFYTNSDTSFSISDGDNWLTGDVERKHAWTVGGRLGYLVTPGVLLYGLAGFSQMKLEGTLDAFIKDPVRYGQDASHSDLRLGLSDWVNGWTVGGGVEAKLDRRFSLKLEYRYATFDGASIATFTPHEQETWTSNGKYRRRQYDDGARLDLGDSDVHSVRAVLSFKLGRDEEQLAPLK